MVRFSAWFAALSLRERILLGSAGGLLALLVAVYGIGYPLMNGVVAARQAHADAVTREARIMAKIDELDGPAAGTGEPVSGALDLFVRQSASEMGLTADDVRAEGDRVSFSFAQVTAPALFGWLADLEQRGLVIQEVDARPAAGSALSARVTLRRP